MNYLPVRSPPMRKSKISLLLSLPGMEVDDFLASEPPRARPLAHNLRKLSPRASRNLHGTFTGCNKVFLRIICPSLPPLYEFPFWASSGKEIKELITVEPPPGRKSITTTRKRVWRRVESLNVAEKHERPSYFHTFWWAGRRWWGRVGSLDAAKDMNVLAIFILLMDPRGQDA